MRKPQGQPVFIDRWGVFFRFEPPVFLQRLSTRGEVGEMPYVIGLLVLVLTVLAGSPCLLAHRAERRRRLDFIRMRRIRLHARLPVRRECSRIPRFVSNWNATTSPARKR
jgi:hypothetical protein